MLSYQACISLRKDIKNLISINYRQPPVGGGERKPDFFRAVPTPARWKLQEDTPMKMAINFGLDNNNNNNNKNND